VVLKKGTSTLSQNYTSAICCIVVKQKVECRKSEKPLQYVEAVEGPKDEISRTEFEKAIKQMRSNKVPGPSGIIAEMIKALDELGVDWLHTIFNEFLTDEWVPDNLKESEIVTIYKQKKMLLNVTITEE